MEVFVRSSVQPVLCVNSYLTFDDMYLILILIIFFERSMRILEYIN